MSLDPGTVVEFDKRRWTVIDTDDGFVRLRPVRDGDGQANDIRVERAGHRWRVVREASAPKPKPTPKPTVAEADLQRAVIDMAQLLGCLVFHDHDSRRNEAGFPDLVIVGKRGVLWIELKTETGRVRPEQQTWLDRLALHQRVLVARPSHLHDKTIERAIRSIR